MLSDYPHYFTTDEAREAFEDSVPYFVSDEAIASGHLPPAIRAGLMLEQRSRVAKGMTHRLTWLEPDWEGNGHKGQIEDAAKELTEYGLHFTYDSLREAILTRGKRDVWDVRDWHKIVNSGASEVTRCRDLLEETRAEKHRLRLILQEYIDGRVMMPTVVELLDGNYFVVNGSKRLMVARVFGVVPDVWCVKGEEKTP